MIREQRMRADYVAVLSLGSNLGDREALIRSAVREIAELPGVVVVKASNLIETPALRPEGVQMDAPAFLNAAVMIRTTLEPHDLLAALNRIEDAHGRVRSQPWGDRTLDIDIISCGALRIDSAGLTVPHPRAAQRAFVLAPWLEIDPGATLPGIGRVDELLLATGQHVSPYLAEPLL